MINEHKSIFVFKMDRVSYKICNETISVFKECNICQYYDTKHKEDYKRFLGRVRAGIISRAETNIRNVTNEPYSKRTNIRILVRFDE